MSISEFEGIASIIGNLFICVGCLVALWQLRSSRLSNEQLKKQATLEYYQKIRAGYKISSNAIKAFRDNEVINVDDIKKDENLSKAIDEYLSQIERFATGVNVGVYDAGVFFDMIGVGVIDMYKRLEKIISYHRDTDNPILCKDLEKLVPTLESIKKKYSKNYLSSSTKRSSI